MSKGMTTETALRRLEKLQGTLMKLVAQIGYIRTMILQGDYNDANNK